jgi:hypothetical protein
MSVTLILLFLNLLTSSYVATRQAVMKIRGFVVKMCLVAEAPDKRNQFAKYWYTVYVLIDCVAYVVQMLQFVRVATPSGTTEHVTRLLNILEVGGSNLDPPSAFSD